MTINGRDNSWMDQQMEGMEFESLLLPTSQAAPPIEPTNEDLEGLLVELEANENTGLAVNRDDFEPIPVAKPQMTVQENGKGVYPLQDKISPFSFAKASDHPFMQYSKAPAVVNTNSIRGLFGNPTAALNSPSTVEEGSGSSSEDESTCKNNYKPKFRNYQCDQWQERYAELCKFYEDHKHSSVPHTDSPYKRLARWVKRQRYQYKLRQEGKPSAMTDERIKLLESLEFVWDSHGAAWEQRLRELEEFKAIHKHCNVPSNYKANSSLASWIKCQRRQYRLYREGKQSNITQARINQLEQMGFQFNPRVGYHHQRLLHSSKGWS